LRIENKSIDMYGNGSLSSASPSVRPFCQQV
jgi:hypothetical protein